MPTAGSMGSDLNGMAVHNACLTLRQRLDDFRKSRPDLSDAPFEKLVFHAYLERINLSAQGFYSVPNIGYDFITGVGRPFSYHVFAMACAEVEIDTLTGNSQVRRADILIDLGDSLNPAIDIGQIEGAFVQGMGLFTMEESVWGTDKIAWIPKGKVYFCVYSFIYV